MYRAPVDEIAFTLKKLLAFCQTVIKSLAKRDWPTPRLGRVRDGRLAGWPKNDGR